MKPLSIERISPHKEAKVYFKDGEYRVEIEQFYPNSDEQFVQVLESKTFKRLSSVSKFIEKWIDKR